MPFKPRNSAGPARCQRLTLPTLPTLLAALLAADESVQLPDRSIRRER
jgi:hypothetical protein